MKGCIFVILALLMTATVATAQHQHTTPNLMRVDGREHPEQIPDEVAYFNFFSHRSLPANVVISDDDRAAFNASVRSIGLSTKDELQFRLVMTDFQTKFQAWLAKHTELAMKGRATGRDFWHAPGGIVSIVAQTRAELKQNLSKDGLVRYEGAVLFMRQSTVWVTSVEVAQ